MYTYICMYVYVYGPRNSKALGYALICSRTLPRVSCTTTWLEPCKDPNPTHTDVQSPSLRVQVPKYRVYSQSHYYDS